nr:fimbrial protein [Dyella sp. ASV24]
MSLVNTMPSRCRSVVCLLALLVALFGAAGPAFACGTPQSQTVLTPAAQTLNLGGPSDRSAQVGTALSGWSAIGQGVLAPTGCSTTSGWSTWGVSNYAALPLTLTGTYAGYPVYASNVSGIGYILQVKDPNQPSQPLQLNPALSLWNTNGSGAGGGSLGIQAAILFVVTGPIRPGSYTLGPQTVGTGWLSNTQTTNTKIQSLDISYSPVTLTVTGTACTVDAGSRNQVVRLPAVSVGSFRGVGSTAGSQSFTMALSCPAGIALYATMTDVSSPANTSNTLTLASSSTASGLGIQVFSNGSTTPVSFGPDTSVKGATNQWYVGGSSSAPATNYTIPFVARYVQTAATVKAGSVSAMSTITFSYQ